MRDIKALILLYIRNNMICPEQIEVIEE